MARASGFGEAELPGGRHDGWSPGRRVVTQADRSQWQRSAAGALRHLLSSFSALPALTWTVSRSGHLSGWAGHEIAAGDRRWAFTAWQEALEFPGARESPGTGGTPARLHARGQWGPVSIGLAASVLPEGADVPGGAGSPFPVTYRQTRAADALVGLLEEQAGTETITWQILPSGPLAGRLRARGPAGGGQALFASWAEALGLREVTVTPTSRGDLVMAGRCTSMTAVSVTITAVIPARRRDVPREALRRSPQPDIIHEPPRPGHRRLGGILLPPYAGPGSTDVSPRSAPWM
jgi:hypothetical protein